MVTGFAPCLSPGGSPPPALGLCSRTWNGWDPLSTQHGHPNPSAPGMFASLSSSFQTISPCFPSPSAALMPSALCTLLSSPPLSLLHEFFGPRDQMFSWRQEMHHVLGGHGGQEPPSPASPARYAKTGRKKTKKRENQNQNRNPNKPPTTNPTKQNPHRVRHDPAKHLSAAPPVLSSGGVPSEVSL